MKINKIALIVTDTTRSKVYLSLLEYHNLLPKFILYLRDRKLKYIYSNKLNLKKNNIVKNKYINEFKKLKIDIDFNIQDKLSKLKTVYKSFDTTDIHRSDVIDLIKNRNEDTFIYSGYPGVIIKNKEILKIKKFLHIHGGYLPKYKGSTTNYFSIIERNKVGASAIILNNDIDSGPILYRKEFSAPLFKESMDHLYDSYFRGQVLIKTLKKIAKNKNKILPLRKKDQKTSENYYIIHPVLKHIAIML